MSDHGRRGGEVSVQVHSLPRNISEAIKQAVAIEVARSTPRVAVPDSSPCKRCQSSSSELTAAEFEVLRLLCDGKSGDEIATIRSRSRKTVESQITSARKKLGAKNFAQLGLMMAKKFGVE